MSELPMAAIQDDERTVQPVNTSKCPLCGYPIQRQHRAGETAQQLEALATKPRKYMVGGGKQLACPQPPDLSPLTSDLSDLCLCTMYMQLPTHTTNVKQNKTKQNHPQFSVHVTGMAASVPGG